MKLSQVLDQVNFALKRAYVANGNRGPKVTSVLMNVQVEDEVDLKASATGLIVSPSVQTSDRSSHSMSFTFVPQLDRKPASEDFVGLSDEDSPLSIAIRTAYHSMNQAQDLTDNRRDFSLQNGSVQIQCAIQTQVGATSVIPILTPIQVGADTSNQVTHTLTLNFAVDETTKKPAAPAPTVTVPVPPAAGTVPAVPVLAPTALESH